MANAKYVTVVHNHPDCLENARHATLSADDMRNADAIAKMGGLIDMQLYDTVVVTSLREKGNEKFN